MISVSHISLENDGWNGPPCSKIAPFLFLFKVDFNLPCVERLKSFNVHGQLAALSSTNLAKQKLGRLGHGLHLHQRSQLVGAAMEKFSLFTCQSQGR